MDNKIYAFLQAHRHGIATLIYLAMMPDKDNSLSERQRNLYKNRRFERICKYVMVAISAETLTQQIEKQQQTEDYEAFLRLHNSTTKKAADAAKILNSDNAFENFKQWQQAQSKSNKALNGMLFDNFKVYQAELQAWLDDNQAALADAQFWLSARAKELSRPRPSLNNIRPPQSHAEFSDCLKAAAIESAPLLPAMLATAGGILVYGIPEDGGRITAEEMALIAEMKATWGLNTHDAGQL